MIGFGAFFAHWAAIDPRGVAVDRFLASQNAWTASGLSTWNLTATSLGAPAYGGVPINVSFLNPILSATLLSLNLVLPLSSVANGLDSVPANYTGGWAGPGFLSHTNGTIPGSINALSSGLVSFSIPSVVPVSQPLFECTVVKQELTAPLPPGGVKTKLLTTGPGARGHRRALLRTSHTSTYYLRTVKRLTSVGLVIIPPPSCVAGACVPTSLYIDPCSTRWSIVHKDTRKNTAQWCSDSSLVGNNMIGASIAVTLRLSSDPVVVGEQLTTCRDNFGLTKQRLSLNAGLLLGFGLCFTCFCCCCLSWGFQQLKGTPPPAAESKSHYDAPLDAGPVRYIKLRRADGLAEYITIVAIDVLDVEGNSIKGISASLHPQFGTPEQLDQFGPQVLVDGFREEFTPDGKYHLAHTEAVPTAWMLLDLGSEQLLSKVVIFNRTSQDTERINGLVLELSNDKGSVVFTSATLDGAHAVYTWSIQEATAEQKTDVLLSPCSPAPALSEDELKHASGFAAVDITQAPQPLGPRVIPCQKIFWHKHILGLPSDTLAWPRMAPLNGMPMDHRVCSVCLQGDDHSTHQGTKWRCTEGCNFDVCESCGTMEHMSIDNVVSVTFSDTQHWCYKCFSFAPCLGQLFSCLWALVFGLLGFFVVLPCKLLCCIETSVCHCLFGERLDHAAAEQAKKEAEEKLAAQRNAASNEATALGMINEANATGVSALMPYQAPGAVMFHPPPIPGIMRPFIPEAYHNPYFGQR